MALPPATGGLLRSWKRSSQSRGRVPDQYLRGTLLGRPERQPVGEAFHRPDEQRHGLAGGVLAVQRPQVDVAARLVVLHRETIRSSDHPRDPIVRQRYPAHRPVRYHGFQFRVVGGFEYLHRRRRSRRPEEDRRQEERRDRRGGEFF